MYKNGEHRSKKAQIHSQELSLYCCSEQLMENKALPLPEVSRVFLEAYGITHFDSIQSLDLTLEVGNSTVQFSSRWVLSQLIIYLKPYMHYKCVHKKFGTVLYKKRRGFTDKSFMGFGCSQFVQQYIQD